VNVSADGMHDRELSARERAPVIPRSRDARVPNAAASIELLSVIMNSSNNALLLAGARGVIVAANPAFELVTGLSANATVGRHLTDLLSPGCGDVARVIARTTLRGGVWEGDVSLRAGDGAPLSLRIKVTPVLDARGGVAHLLVHGSDETNRPTRAELDPQVQTLGRLSSSIAHDFNNQLSVIINYTHIISAELPNDSPLRDQLHEVQTTAWRASRLANQLIALGRRPITEPQNLNLNEVISNLAPLLRTLLGDRVTLHTTLDPELWRVMMVLPQAEQVLVNLAVNARDAMVGAGDVNLVTSNVTLRADDPTRPIELAPGCYVRLSLSERAAQANPSAVTPVDAETPLSGLGPTMIYRAIRQAGGVLALLANDDGSTTFRIHLPALGTDDGPLAQSSEGPTLSS